MAHKRPPVSVILLVVAVLAVSAWYVVITQQQKAGDGTLTASGTVEAVNVIISPELGGKVAEVFVDEGDMVQAGGQLFRLDDSLLQAQREVAAAGLDSAHASLRTAQAAVDAAQAQYELTLKAALAEEQAGRTADWRQSKPTEFDQPTWFFDKPELIAAAQAEIQAAQDALTKAQEKLTFVEQKSSSGDFLMAEKDLAKRRQAFEVAKEVLDRTNGADQDLRDSAQTAYDEAKADLQDAQKAYDDALTTDGSTDILTARADVTIAQERLDTARDKLDALQTGAQSPRVTTAEKAVAQAEAGLAQVQTAIKQAEAQLALIDTQLAKLTVPAPADGVVLTRSVQPGEVLSPGSQAFILVRLDDLTITVYVPEDRYGEISLGQSADVSVDSFPGMTFHTTVVYISDQAEFTPRNVQTVEGRSSTVYAIKLKVDDPSGKLKAGMPADVTFK
jgi:HlyD family secretion protein